MARKRGGAATRVWGVARLPRSALLRETALQGVAVLCVLVPYQASAQLSPNARPTGGQVTTGSATIGYAPATTTINQSSQNAAINWTTYNVGSAQTVQYNQPNAKAVIVNRVAAGDPSQIAGHINANGVFVLTNPSGVVFTKGAQVNANSVIVTTAGIADKNVAAGKLVFDQPGKPGAMVVNKGNISVAQTGLAALVAPGVANAGVISAPMGKVVLAGAEAHVVDLYGDGLMSIDVTKQVATVPAGPGGKPVTALVTNTGVITATGGRVLLTAQAVDGIVTNLVDAGGKISANTARNGQAGTIVVNGIGGSLTIEGELSAQGRASGAAGGAVELNASNGVVLMPKARVNASGAAGGGTIAIGTSLARAAGGPSVTGQPTAKTVTVAVGAKVSASATRKGNGGKVTVLSTEQTTMAGSIVAKGGRKGGDGGFVEVSGDKGFSLTGSADVSARLGNSGTILLDPANLEVVNGTTGAGNLDGSLVSGGGTIATGTTSGTTPETVTNGEIATLGGTIVLQAGTNLVVDTGTPITLKPGASLVLQTGTGDITVNANSPIIATASAGAGGAVSLLAGTSAVATGSITLGSNITADRAVTLKAAGSIDLGATTLTAASLDISTQAGNVVQGPTGKLAITGPVFSSVGVGGSVTLAGSANAIGALGDLAATGSIAVTNNSAIAVSGSLGAGTTLILSAPTLALGNGTLSGAGGQVSVRADSFTVAAGGTITAGSGGSAEFAPFTSGNAVALGGTNAAGQLGIVPSGFALTARTLRIGAANGTTTAGSIRIAGAVSLSASSGLDLRTTGSITQASGATLIAGTLSGSAAAVALTGATNRLAAVGMFSAVHGFALTHGGSLALNGLIDSNQGTLLIDNGTAALTLGPGGTLLASEAMLAAGSMDLGGSVNVSGLVALTASTGTISNTGSFSAGTLMGEAAGLANLGTATVGSIGAFTADGFTLLNAGSLSVDGFLNGGTSPILLTAASAGLALTQGGTIGTSGNVTLAAGSIDLNGSVLAAGGTFSLTASAGAITEAGTAVIQAGTLTGLAAGVADLQGANAIGTLGTFQAGSLILNNGTSDLTVGGLVTAGTTVALGTAGRLFVPGTIMPGSGTIGIGLSAGPTLSIGGIVSDGGGTTSLQSTGTIVTGGTLVSGVLTGSGAAVGLNGSISTLGSFTATSSLGLTDAVALTVAGIAGTGGTVLVSAPTLTLGDGTTAGTLMAGTLVSVRTGTIALGAMGGRLSGGSATVEVAPFAAGDTLAFGTAAGAANVLGFDPGVIPVTAGTLRLGSQNGTTVAGSIVIAGTTDLHALNLLELRSANAVTQSAPLVVAALAGNAGSVVLSGTGNAIGVLRSFTATNGFTLANAASLDVNGVLNANAGTVSLDTGTYGLGIAGRITAAAAVLNASSIAVTGSVDVAGGAALTAAGAISESGAGFIGATMLTGSAGSVSLPGANAIGTIADFSAVNGFTLTNAHSLTATGLLDAHDGTLLVNNGTFALALNGSVTAQAVSLSAGSIDLNGTLAVAGSAALTAAGNIQQASSAAFNAGTLTGSAGGVASLLGTNLISRLGTFDAGSLLLNAGTAGMDVTGIVTAGTSIAINAGSLLAVDGTVAARAGSTIALALAADTITIGGMVSDGGAGQTQLLATHAGTITETGSLTVGTLTGSAALASLTGSNTVAVLGSFSAGTLLLNDTTDLSVAGPVAIGTQIAINDGGFLSIPGSITPSGGDIAVGLTAAGLSIAGFINAGTGGSVVLLAPSGTISEAGTLIAGTLSGTADVVSLPGSNVIAELDDIAAGSTLLVRDTRSLDIAGAASAGGLAYVAAPALTVDGRVGAPRVTLDAYAGTLAVNGVITAGSVAALNGSLGIAGASGTILGDGTLAATSGSGSVVLTNALNAVGTITGSAAGGFAVSDGTSATIGNVSAGDSIAITGAGSLQISGTVGPLSGSTIAVGLTGLAIGIGGVVSDGGQGTMALDATGGDVSGAGTIIAGTLSVTGSSFAMSHGAVGTIAILSNMGSVVLDDTGALSIATSINATGLVSIAAGTLEATGAITGDAVTLAANHGTLGLFSTISAISGISLAGSAGIDGAGAVLLAPSGSLTASGAGGSVTLINPLNTVASVAGSAGGDFRFRNAQSLSAGNITATGTLGLEASALTVSGKLTAPAEILLADSGSLSVPGSLAPSVSAFLNAPSGLVQVSGQIKPSATNAVSLTLSGATIDIGGLVSDGGRGSTALFASNGGTIQESGTLIAGILTGSAATANLIDAPASANLIGTLGSFSAGTLVLNDGTNLAITGPVTIGQSASIVADGSIDLSGTLAAAAGSAIAIGLTATNLAINGLLSDGGAGTTWLAINGGTISETGRVVAGTLGGSAAVVGLGAPGNTIATASGLTATGAFTLLDAAGLTIAGQAGGGSIVSIAAPSVGIGTSGSAGTLFAANGGLVSVKTGTLLAGNAGGTIAAPSGTIEVAPSAAADTVLLGDTASAAGTLGVKLSSFALNAGTLRIGGNNGTIASGAITIGGSSASAVTLPVLELLTSGAVTQTQALSANTLTGSAGSVALTAAGNTIGTIGAFTAPQGFALNNAGSLAVAGSLASSAGAVALDATGSPLTLNGGITGTSVALSGSALFLNGSVGSAGLVTLTGSSGAIVQAGSAELNAGTLAGLATLATLNGINLVGTLGNVTAINGFSLKNGQALSVAGTVAAPSGTVALDTGTFGLGVGGRITAAAVALHGGSIAVGGRVDAAGLLAMTAGTGAISAPGFINAGTLMGSAASTASLSGTNLIATLGSFSAPAGFILSDSEDLLVTGPVSVTGGTALLNIGTHGLGIQGGITAAAATLSAGSINVAGSLGVNGLLSIAASNAGGATGAIVEAGSAFVNAATLAGSASTVSLNGSNQIGILADFAAPGGFSLTDASALLVSGHVVADDGTVLINTGTYGLGISGGISAAAASLSAGGITLSGSLGVAGAAALIAGAGTIFQAGTAFLNAGKLTGSAAASAVFSGTNAIGTLAGFTAPSGFLLKDTTDLTMTGTLGAASGRVLIDDGSGQLHMTGTAIADSLTLAAGGINGGTLLVSNTVSLASAGSIEVDYISAGTLTGHAATAATMLGGATSYGVGGNAVAVLADFDAPSGFVFANGQALRVSGSVTAASGTVLIRSDVSSLAVDGLVSGANVSLAAGAISIPGSVITAGSASISASLGDILETGVLNAGTLIGGTGANANANFTGTNAIANLGSFTTGTGSFTLLTQTGLTVTGPSADNFGSVLIDTAHHPLTLNGRIAGGSVSLAGSDITINTELDSTGLHLTSDGTIVGSGPINAGSVIGSAGNYVSLTGLNAIGSIGDFTTAGFTLTNVSALSLAGTLNASPGTLVVTTGTSALNIMGHVTAAAATLSAGTIGLTGLLGADHTVSLSAVAGGITQAGTAFLNAGTLTGAVVTGVTLAGTNAIGVLAGFTAPNGFLLRNAASLSVVGALAVNGGPLALLNGSAALDVLGTINAQAVTISAGTIGLTGALSSTSVASLTATTGGVTEAGTAFLNAATLTGSVATGATLTGTNLVSVLGDFRTQTGFALLDGEALTVAGSVVAPGGAVVLASGNAGLGIPGTIIAQDATLNAGSVAVGGFLDITDRLHVTGSALTEAGTASVNAGTLSGGVTGSVSLPGTNAIGAVGDFSAPSGFILHDRSNLTVGGLLSSGNVVVLDTGTFGLGVPGTITAASATLTAGSIDIGGSVGVAGILSLTGSLGAVTEAAGGFISAATLTGRAGTAAWFGGGNAIGSLAAFDAPDGFLLKDGLDLTVNGPVTTNGAVVLDTGPSALAVAGTVLAGSGTLTAGAIAVSGSIGVAGVLSLASTLGAITEDSGAFISAPTLTGVAGTSASFAGTNTIAALADFTAPTGFGLRDTQALTVAGTLLAQDGVARLDAGANALSVPGLINAHGVTLAAGAIGVDGWVDAAGLMYLNAGTITAGGALSAGTLAGTAGVASLTGANLIGTLGSFTAGVLTLNDTGALQVAGPVAIGGSIALVSADTLSVTGAITPQSGPISVGLTAAAMSISGLVSDGGTGTTSLLGTNGGISESGTLIAGVLTVSAQSSGPQWSDVGLYGFNRIGTLASLYATGNVGIIDNQDLLVSGSVLAGTHNGSVTPASAPFLEIDVLRAGGAGSGNLTIGPDAALHAGLDGALMGNVMLRAGNDTVAGAVAVGGAVYAADGGAVQITAGYNTGSGAWHVVGSGSTITLTGTIWGDQVGGGLAGLVNLGAADSIDQASPVSAIGAALLTGQAGTHANLSQSPAGTRAGAASTNRIATLGRFTTNTGGRDDAQGFLLRDGQALTIAGPVMDLGTSNSRGISIAVAPSGGGAYTAADLMVSGLVKAQTGVNLQATGNVIETRSGTVFANSLSSQAGVIPSTETSGNAAGAYPLSVTQAGAAAFFGNAANTFTNRIGTLASATSTGTLSLYDLSSLTTAGTVLTGITPASASTAGSVAVGTGMTLVTPGLLRVTGTLDVATQAGVMSLTGDTVALGNEAGPALKAATIQVFAASGVTTSNGTVLETGGDMFKRPLSGTAPVDPGPATAGAHFLVGSSGFQQTGGMTVQSYVADTASGATVTVHPELDIRLTTGNGAIAFDSGSGLSASSTSLLMTVGSMGSAAGRVVADDLAVFYTGTFGHGTSIFGTLRTQAGLPVSGQAAASQAYIAREGVYLPSNHFQVNGCAISSINCVLISPFSAVPVVNPLKDLPTAFVPDQAQDPDLLIPNVSDRED